MLAWMGVGRQASREAEGRQACKQEACRLAGRHVGRYADRLPNRFRGGK